MRASLCRMGVLIAAVSCPDRASVLHRHTICPPRAADRQMAVRAAVAQGRGGTTETSTEGRREMSESEWGERAASASESSVREGKMDAVISSAETSCATVDSTHRHRWPLPPGRLRPTAQPDGSVPLCRLRPATQLRRGRDLGRGRRSKVQAEVAKAIGAAEERGPGRSRGGGARSRLRLCYSGQAQERSGSGV